jgi:hypothetical protein
VLLAYTQANRLAWVPMVPSESFGVPGVHSRPLT